MAQLLIIENVENSYDVCVSSLVTEVSFLVSSQLNQSNASF